MKACFCGAPGVEDIGPSGILRIHCSDPKCPQAVPGRYHITRTNARYAWNRSNERILKQLLVDMIEEGQGDEPKH